MIANTIFQVLYGRLSDALGRKVVFLTAVGLLSLGTLACSFAQTGPQLYVFRGVSGVGTGGITALAMMIVSDVVTLENRGKYQGILGACVGLGSTVGPFLAAGFISTSSWRALYWTISPLAFLSGMIVAWILPPSKTTGRWQDKLRTIDYWGLLTSSASLLLLLIPISGGGTYFEWTSPMVISMLTLGSVAFILFLVIEWKFAQMPMMPLYAFRNPPVCAIIIQHFLYGVVYYSHLYFLPIYYQNVRQYSVLRAATLTIPLVVSQAVFSTLSGLYISRFKRYGEIIWSGYTIWFVASGLLLLFNRTIKPWAMVLILICEGIGVGFVFQPSLIAAQAHSSKNDRAVVISVRSFIRALGGAFGLAVSSAIFSNKLNASTTALPQSIRNQVRQINLGVPDVSRYNPQQASLVLDAYAAASHTTFLSWVPFMGVCLLLCFLIKDRGLQLKEEKPADASSIEEAVEVSDTGRVNQEDRMEKGGP
ncbi:hypothetical protein VTL71DRAFT_9605, partial [Oculimacula yallundae]